MLIMKERRSVNYINLRKHKYSQWFAIAVTIKVLSCDLAVVVDNSREIIIHMILVMTE